MAGIEVLLNTPLVEAIGLALLHFVWQGALVGAVTAITLRLLRASAADVRYVIAAVSLSLMATLPIVTGVQAYRGLEEKRLPTVHTTSAGAPSIDTGAGPIETDAGQLQALVPQAVAALPEFERWMPVVVLGWMLGVGILAIRLAGGWLWMQRMKSHGAEPADAALQAVVKRLSRSLHIARAITLLRSPGVDVPTVIGWLKPTVLLPMSALAGLSPLQIEAILAHELAHVRRHDYFVNLLQTLLETMLFYHPAVWWVSRQIRIERENCCDDLAVSLCGDPVVYASALADLEDLRGTPSRFAMAATGGVLLNRVRRLLTGPAPHAGRGPAWLAGTSVALLVLVIIGATAGRQSLSADSGSIEAIVPSIQVGSIAPAPPATASVPPTVEAWSKTETPQSIPAPPAPPTPPSPPSLPEGQSTQIHEGGKRSSGNFVWSNDGEKISIKYDGAFEIDEQDTGIKSIAPDGFLHVADGEGHLVEFTSDRRGALSTRYTVNGRERAFEPEGRQWLATILPRFIRQSGFGAGSRVGRFLRTGGVAAVLAEISRIESSYAKKAYFSELLKQSPVDAANARLILEQAGREIKSDYELASLLISRMDKLLVDEATQKAYFEAARTIESDYEMRRVFGAALKRGTVPASLATVLLDAARAIDSDYEAASLLVDFIKLQGIESSREPFFAALKTVGSSYERSKVLLSVLRRTDVSGETLIGVLNAAGTIGSDYETRKVLESAARAHDISGPARDVYIKVADRMGNYEQTQALAALARRERR